MKRTAVRSTTAAVLLLSMSLSGCATIFTGTRQNVQFQTNPSGATVLIDGLEQGRTPLTLPLRKPGFSGTTVTFRMQGYEDRTIVLDTSFNLATLGNVLLLPIWALGLVGFGVDAVTGAMFNYERTSYNVDLVRARASLAEHLKVDHVALITELPVDENGNPVVGEELKGKKVAIVDPVTQMVMVLK